MFQINTTVSDFTIVNDHAELFPEAADYEFCVGVGEVNHETLSACASAATRPTYILIVMQKVSTDKGSKTADKRRGCVHCITL